MPETPLSGTSDEPSLLLYVQVPFYETPDGFHVETQALNGLARWRENFARLTVMAPRGEGPVPEGFTRLDSAADLGPGIDMQLLPFAYRPDRFLRHLGPTRRLIRRLIAGHTYLVFAIGGLFGDWGAVAGAAASRMNRPFAVWTDRVESEVVRSSIPRLRGRRRLKARLTHRPMAALERYIIGKAALGLFHGHSTYSAYRGFSTNPQLVHDIHLKPEDRIDPAALEDKRAGVATGPLRICYCGRAADMKGPFEWLETLARLKAAGVDFSAVWYGAGPDLETMRARAAADGLAERISFPGFVSDRPTILAALRAAHVLLYCHKTPESPRILIESLMSATPLVGFHSAFAEDLIAANGGGILGPLGDTGTLAEGLARLAADRGALRDLIDRAHADGRHFDDESVFRHRSDLIKRHLPARPGGAAQAAP